MPAGPEDVAVWLAEREELSQRVRVLIEAQREAGRLPPHPAPEVSCRPALDGEAGGAALALQRAVQRAGGTVLVTYARGWGVHGTTGRPTAVRDSIAVRCRGPAGQRLVACWTRPDGGKWTCDLRLSWGRDAPLRLLTDDAMKSEVASWRGQEVVSPQRSRNIDKGDDMAKRVSEPVALPVADKRQYGKIGWDQYADGTVWELERGDDWGGMETPTKVRQSAARFAEREGHVVKYGKVSDSSVRVQFVSHKSIAEAHAAGGTHEQIADHYGIPVRTVHDAIAAHKARQSRAQSAPAVDPFATARS